MFDFKDGSTPLPSKKQIQKSRCQDPLKAKIQKTRPTRSKQRAQFVFQEIAKGKGKGESQQQEQEQEQEQKPKSTAHKRTVQFEQEHYDTKKDEQLQKQNIVESKFKQIDKQHEKFLASARAATKHIKIACVITERFRQELESLEGEALLAIARCEKLAKILKGRTRGLQRCGLGKKGRRHTKEQGF